MSILISIIISMSICIILEVILIWCMDKTSPKNQFLYLIVFYNEIRATRLLKKIIKNPTKFNETRYLELLWKLQRSYVNHKTDRSYYYYTDNEEKRIKIDIEFCNIILDINKNGQKILLYLKYQDKELKEFFKLYFEYLSRKKCRLLK